MMEKKLCNSDQEYIEFIRSFPETQRCIEDLEKLLGIEWGITLRGITYYASGYDSLSDDLLEEIEKEAVDFSAPYRMVDKEVWPETFPVVAILNTEEFEGNVRNEICFVYPTDFSPRGRRIELSRVLQAAERASEQVAAWPKWKRDL